AAADKCVRCRERNDRFESRQDEREQIGLVVVGVDDVDSAPTDERAKRRPDRTVEGVPLDDFLVDDPEIPCAAIECEYPVARVADVADHGLDTARALQRGARENRLVRAATGAPHAAELEDPNVLHRIGARAVCGYGTWPRWCEARLTIAAARASS